MAFIISVPIPIPVPIPKFQCRGLQMAKLQPERINQWFISIKLSLNVTKTRYLLFHKSSIKENIQLFFTKINDK